MTHFEKGFFRKQEELEKLGALPLVPLLLRGAAGIGKAMIKNPMTSIGSAFTGAEIGGGIAIGAKKMSRTARAPIPGVNRQF